MKKMICNFADHLFYYHVVMKETQNRDYKDGILMGLPNNYSLHADVVLTCPIFTSKLLCRYGHFFLFVRQQLAEHVEAEERNGQARQSLEHINGKSGEVPDAHGDAAGDHADEAASFAHEARLEHGHDQRRRKYRA